MEFTYYGDLLGISGYYKLGAEIAKEKLNVFYNTCFSSLSDYCQENSTAHVTMFSDSILFTGDNAEEGLEELHRMHMKLLHKGLLLRGAIVEGKLNFEDRLTINNFQKMLPKDDTLARAVGLESTKKGARLLIEPALARRLLSENREWLTHEGYLSNINKAHYSCVSYESILRRICPTPEQDFYECLYFWVCHRNLEHHETDYEVKIDYLQELSSMLGDVIKPHYKETISLLQRCNRRQSRTKKEMLD